MVFKNGPCAPSRGDAARSADVKEFPLTSLRMSITGLQLSESNNNKRCPATSYASNGT